jgi:hypothetical protein
MSIGASPRAMRRRRARRTTTSNVTMRLLDFMAEEPSGFKE